MLVKHLHHKLGGKITEIHAVGHETVDRIPYWFYVCSIEWIDGSHLKGAQRDHKVEPGRLCIDVADAEALAEINLVSERLNDYLRAEGRWLKAGKWIGDYLVHWLPKRAEGRLTLQ